MSGKTIIAIATGDPAGIGPEISLKATRDPAVRAACHAGEGGLFGREEIEIIKRVVDVAAAHGSAHDIAGNGVASPAAMIEAVLRLAKAP